MKKKKIGMIGAAVCVALVAGAQTMMRVQQLASGWSAPAIVQVTTNPVTVLSTNTLRADGGVLCRFVQNVGTLPVLYLIGATNISATNYHGVIAGGQANRDGLGSVLDLSRTSWPVTFMTESATGRVSVVEMTR